MNAAKAQGEAFSVSLPPPSLPGLAHLTCQKARHSSKKEDILTWASKIYFNGQVSTTSMAK